MIKIRIHVTKEILKRSMMCGIKGRTKNCAVALAIRDIFPTAVVYTFGIVVNETGTDHYDILFPEEVFRFIQDFDQLVDSPEKRLDLPELSFEVEVPDEVVNSIGLEEVKKILAESETLELV